MGGIAEPDTSEVISIDEPLQLILSRDLSPHTQLDDYFTQMDV